MGFFSSTSAIEQYFSTTWTYTPVAWENVQFDATNLDEWVRFVDQNASGNRAALGNNPLYRYRGIVTVQIFVKPNVGQKRVSDLIDNLTTLFRDQVISGVNFGVPHPTKIGIRDGWYQVNVLCPYYRDEE